MYQIPYEQLWKHVTDQFPCGPHSIHGPDHWRRVERNGLILAAAMPHVDRDILRLFALFHDSQRVNDGYDQGHGLRGAEFARTLLGRTFEGKPFQLDENRFEILFEACALHTDRVHHVIETIGCCMDADRLDLPRVGIETRSEYLNTDLAKVIADSGGMDRYLKRSDV